MYKVGRKIILNEGQATAKIRKNYYKTLLVPVATVGCGKTTLASALAKLFSFGHIQSDNIIGNRTRSKFYRYINREFKHRDVVIADRNNHMRDLRKTLIEGVKQSYPDVRIVAICWNHEDLTSSEIFQITYNRIIARGENHQSLTTLTSDSHIRVWNFLNEFERLDSDNDVDNQFDHVIDLDIDNDIITNLKIVINELGSIIGIEKPSKDVIEGVLSEVKNHKVTVFKPIRKPTIKAAYYGIALDFNVQDYLSKYFDEHPYEDSKTFKVLVREKRIRSANHVTLIHTSQLKDVNIRKVWQQYEKLCEGPIQQVRVYFDKVVFNRQIMALVVNRIDPPAIYSLNKVAHVTVGTVDSSVKPVQANVLCELALFGSYEKEKLSEIQVIDLEQELVVDGTVKAYQY